MTINTEVGPKAFNVLQVKGFSYSFIEGCRKYSNFGTFGSVPAVGDKNSRLSRIKIKGEHRNMGTSNSSKGSLRDLIYT